MTPPPAALLLLVDARLPTGGHSHSGGVEAAVAAREVSDSGSLSSFLLGRLSTAGAVETAFAAASSLALAPASELCAEFAARCASPALRAASRSQGRGLLRAATATWPSLVLDEACETPYLPIVLGVIARALALSPGEASLAAAHAIVSGPAWAAVRLLGLDPFAVARTLGELLPIVDRVAQCGEQAARGAAGAAALPCLGAPLLDIDAEHHEHCEVRLFAS